MSEPEAHGAQRAGTPLERSKDEVLAAARLLPPDEDVLFGDLTEDEDRLYLTAVLDT